MVRIHRRRSSAGIAAAILTVVCLASSLSPGFAAESTAGEVQARAVVNTKAAQVGDRIVLNLEVTHPAGITVNWPKVSDALRGFEVLDPGKVSTETVDRNVREQTSIALTSFDAGTCEIPSLTFEYFRKGDPQKQSVSTQPVRIDVSSVQVDTKQDIKDVKPPQKVPLSWQEVMPYVLAGAGAALLFVLLHRLWKRRKKGEKTLPEAPKRPPHELALEALRALETKRLWQQGKVKEYYSELTDILRTYIERRDGILAMEMTTEDILEAGRWEEKPRNDLRAVLVPADLVKFAKMQPAPQEHEHAFGLAMSFVEFTCEPVSVTLPAEGGLQEEKEDKMGAVS